MGPLDDDVDGKEETTEGVEPPDIEEGTSKGKDNGEEVEDN